MIRNLIAASVIAVLVAPTLAGEKPTLELKLIAKKDSFAWPYSQTPKAFEAALKELEIKKKAGKEATWPAPPSIDLVLRITNTGKDKAAVFVGGDANVFVLALNGPGVYAVEPGLAFTADFRSPKELMLEAGKSHEIPIAKLADGFRGGSRYVYPTMPGEYSLSATYQLATADGGKGPLLKSNEVEFKIEEPK